MTTSTLSARQRAILNHLRRNGHRRRLSDVGEATGLALSTVFSNLRALRRGGFLAWNDGEQGTLRLTDKGLLAAQGWRELYRVWRNGKIEMAEVAEARELAGLALDTWATKAATTGRVTV